MRKVARWAVSADPPAPEKHVKTIENTWHRLSYRVKVRDNPSTRLGFRPRAFLPNLNDRQSRYGVALTFIAPPASGVPTVAFFPNKQATIVPLMMATATTKSSTPLASSSSVLGAASPTQDLEARTLTAFLYGLERASTTLHSSTSQQPWTIPLRPLTDSRGLVLRLHSSRVISLIGGLAMSPRFVTDHASPDLSVATSLTKPATNISVTLASSTKILSALPAQPTSSHPASAFPPQDSAAPPSEDPSLSTCAPLTLSISLRLLWLCEAPRIDRLTNVLLIVVGYMKGIVLRLHRSMALLLFGGLTISLPSTEDLCSF